MFKRPPILALVSLISGCALLIPGYLGAPSLNYYWAKQKYTPYMTSQVMYGQCNFGKVKTWNDRQQADQCMLDKGFSYSDYNPMKFYGIFKEMIHYCSEYKDKSWDGHLVGDLPSCQSIDMPVSRNPKDLDCYETAEVRNKGTCGLAVLNNINLKNPG